MIGTAIGQLALLLMLLVLLDGVESLELGIPSTETKKIL